MIAGAYERWSFTRDFNYRALTGNILVFWIDGYLKEAVVAHWGSTVDEVNCWRLFFRTEQVQEVPSDEFQEGGVFLGPILRINCIETVQFSRSVTIQLPLSLREQQVLLPDPTTYRVRVLFLKSDDQEKEWTEITDDLGKPASFDGKFVRFQDERFSG